MNPENRVISRSPGILQGIADHFKLITRLMIDRRVHPLLKLLPLGTLAYLLLPADLMPMLPLDDAAVIWAGTALFIELCPPEVVEDARRLLAAQNQPATDDTTQGDTVDAEYRDI